jgi:hypothetical protein
MTFLVNGKSPVAAWIPSVDSVGANTTTLTDMQTGAYPMTLSGMLPSGCWVTDTERGGERALKFSGSNAGFSRAVTTAFQFGPTFTITFWAKFISATGRRPIITIGNASVTNKGIFAYISSNVVRFDLSSVGGLQTPFVVNFGTWVFCAIRSTTGVMDICVGGVRTVRSTSLFPDIDQTLSGTKINVIGTDFFGNNGNNSDLFDDFRLWSTFLDDSDLSLLATYRGYKPAATGNLLLPSSMNGGYSA